jgi:8-oxo-dGTP pyrophosphatase MutT (NUDIX family)
MGLSAPDLIKKVLAQRVKQVVSDSNLMPAAVLLLLYPKDGEYCVLLNKRSELVEHHKGEISLPGGARDPEDRDFLETALREAEEEMGINRADVTILGELDDVVTRTNFGVRVYIGTIPYPYPFQPSPIEIAEVVEVPISSLCDLTNIRCETRWVDGLSVTAYSYAYNQQFLEVLEDGLKKEGN